MSKIISILHLHVFMLLAMRSDMFIRTGCSCA
jgi:hypothetical protein